MYMNIGDFSDLKVDANMTKSNDPKPKYYTVEQLAKYTNLSVPTIRRYIRYEGLPHFRINRRILINPDEFDQWMEQHRQQQMAEQTRLDRVVQEVVDDFGL